MPKKIFFNDRIILCLIVLNTMFIFADGVIFGGRWIMYIDTLFTLFFLAEVVVKIHVLGWKAYWREGWNRFDFIITILALPSLTNLFVDEAMIETNVLFAFRVLRVFKSFLLFRHIPNMSKILHGIHLAIKSSLLISVAYTVFLIVFSILTHALFSKHAPQYFGSPLISLYSIFRLFTVEGWYEMPEAVAANGGVAMGILARLYFATLLFLGGIMGMSLVNSIFVDAMVSDNNDEVLEKLDKIEKELQQLKNK